METARCNIDRVTRKILNVNVNLKERIGLPLRVRWMDCVIDDVCTKRVNSVVMGDRDEWKK